MVCVATLGDASTAAGGNTQPAATKSRPSLASAHPAAGSRALAAGMPALASSTPPAVAVECAVGTGELRKQRHPLRRPRWSYT